MIRYYFNIAFHNLLKYKTQNFIAITGLTVGLLCFSICFYCSRYMFSVDSCFEKHDRIVEICLQDENGKCISGTPAALLGELRKQMCSEVETYTSVAYPRKRAFDVQITDEKQLPYEFHCMEVDTSYISCFTPRVIAGCWKAASHTPNAIVLTKSTALKIFPNITDALGKLIITTSQPDSSIDKNLTNGETAYTIEAIIDDIPDNNSMSFMKTIELIVLNDSKGILQSPRNNDFTGAFTYALLSTGKTLSELNKRYHSMKLTHNLFDSGFNVIASPLGKKNSSAEVSRIFGMVTEIVGLLICIVGLLNFFHFQIGTFLNRKREFSIHKFLGNNTNQLFWILFVQLLLIIIITTLSMLGLIEIIAPYLQLSFFRFNLLISKETLMFQVGEYMVGISLLSAIICWLTSFYMHRISVKTGLRGNKRQNKHSFRNVMLGIQFFVCWIFVSCTLALYLQAEETTSTLFNTLTKKEKKLILSVPLRYSFMKNEEKSEFIQRIRQSSGVENVITSEIGYMNGISGTGVQLEKGNKDRWINVASIRISKGFLSFMNISLIAGRDIQNENEMIVDEAFALKIGNDALGRTFNTYEGNSYTICGIIPHVNAYVYNDEFGQKRSTNIYLPSSFNDFIGHCYIKCHPNKVEEVKRWADKQLREILPASITPVITTFQEEINEAQAIETKLKGIVLFFSVVCMIITLLGVYSAITLDTDHRQKEVAIRKVNGAGLKQIILLFVRFYIYLLTITAILALPIAYFLLEQWHTMYTVFFDNGFMFWAGNFILVTCFTLMTIMFRIVKTAHINPADVIKNE